MKLMLPVWALIGFALAILILPPQPAPNPGPSHRIDLWARDSYVLTCGTSARPFDMVVVEGSRAQFTNGSGYAISTNLALGTTGKCGMAELKAGEWYTITIHLGDKP